MRNQYESELWTLVHLTKQNKILFSVFNANKSFTINLNETKDNTFFVDIDGQEINVSHEPFDTKHSFSVKVEIKEQEAIFNIANQEQILFKKV